MEATPAEIIARLEVSRGVLVGKRIGLERKIADLDARQGLGRKVEDGR